MIPRDPTEVTPEWLTETLEKNGHLNDGTVIEIKRDVLAEGLTGPVQRLILKYDGNHEGAPQSIVIKMPTSDESRLTFLSTAGQLFREYAFYRELAGSLVGLVPKHYFVETSDDPVRGVIGLEDLTHMRTGQHGSSLALVDAEAAISSLAKIHARFWRDPSLQRLSWLLYPGVYFGGESRSRMIENIAAVKTGFGDRLSIYVNDLLSVLPGGLEEIEKRWSREPTTLLLGDSRSQNMFFEGSGTKVQAMLIDWQTPTRSSGAIDLVTFLVMSFAPNERASIEGELLPFYHSELVSQGVDDYSFGDLEDDFRWGLFRPLLMAIRAVTDMGFGNMAVQRFGPRLVALEEWDCLHLID